MRTNGIPLTARSPSTVLVRADAAIPESCVSLASVHGVPLVKLEHVKRPFVQRTVLVGVVGLLGTVLVAQPLGHGLGSVGSIALAMPHDGLLNCPRRWVSRPVGVELGVIACGVVSECSGTVQCVCDIPSSS